MLTRDQTVFFYITHSASYEKSKFLSSEESIIVRLKLKEINGRISQDIKPAA